MERRTVVAAAVAAGMCCAAGAFTVSAVADPPPAVQIAQVQPAPTSVAPQPVVHQVTTVDDVVVVTTVAKEAVRSMHSDATGGDSAAQLSAGGAP